MTPSRKIQEHGPLIQRSAHLWTLDGEWYDTKFKRRMTLIRLRSQGLVVHNAIQLREEDYGQIDALGKVEYIFAPNAFHATDAHVYKERYPKAHLYVSKGARREVQKRCEIDGTLPGALGSNLQDEIDCLEFAGTRLLYETVFFHPESKTLIVTDLVFHMKCEVSGFEKAFFKFNRLYERFGPSRIFQMIFLGSKREAAKSLRHLLQWDFDRVIMNHGEILETGGKQAILKGFKDIGIEP